MQAFMQSENRGTDGVPAKQIPSLDRLMGGVMLMREARSNDMAALRWSLTIISLSCLSFISLLCIYGLRMRLSEVTSQGHPRST